MVSAKSGGLIYTTGLDKGIPIGCLKVCEGRKVLEVKNGKRIDCIPIGELTSILVQFKEI